MKRVCAIIMPAYKSAPYILQAINSLKTQKLPKDWQIKFYIGVDGCPETATILSNNLIDYYYSSSNVGCHVMCNSLIKQALLDNCDILVKFDSDNYALEDFLYIGITNTLKNGVVTPLKIICDHALRIISTKSKSHSGTIFFTANALKELGGYSPYRVSSDKYLLIRANLLGYKDKHKGPRARILVRRLADSLIGSPDTGLNSEYRKAVNKLMEAEIDSGVLCVEPEVTKITMINSDLRICT